MQADLLFNYSLLVYLDYATGIPFNGAELVYVSSEPNCVYSNLS